MVSFCDLDIEVIAFRKICKIGKTDFIGGGGAHSPSVKIFKGSKTDFKGHKEGKHFSRGGGEYPTPPPLNETLVKDFTTGGVGGRKVVVSPQ